MSLREQLNSGNFKLRKNVGKILSEYIVETLGDDAEVLNLLKQVAFDYDLTDLSESKVVGIDGYSCKLGYDVNDAFVNVKLECSKGVVQFTLTYAAMFGTLAVRGVVVTLTESGLDLAKRMIDTFAFELLK